MTAYNGSEYPNDLREAERRGFERARELAAEVANRWTKSTSCTHHDSDPCCHVRTGASIAECIRALKFDEVEDLR